MITAAFSRRLLVAVAVVVVSAREADGQRAVIGFVRDSVTGVPLTNTIVTLIDSLGHTSRRVTNADGRFALLITHAGARVELIRIGYRPRQVMLGDDSGADSLLIHLSPLPNWLAPVATTADATCPPRADRAAAFALWEQARTALLATVVARETNHGAFGVVAYDRLLYKAPADPRKRTRRQYDARALPPIDTSRILSQRITRSVIESGHPVHSPRTAARFKTDGFMEASKARRTFYAPDADVVLDTAFAATHCFSLRTSDSRPRELGLAFEPARGRESLVEVSGALWIDGASRSLRTLEFRFTALESDAMAAGAGGELNFAQAPNGVVFIHRWRLRVPYRYLDAIAVFGNGQPAGDSAWLFTRTGELHDEGGAIVEAIWPDGTTWQHPFETLSGNVVDRAGRALRQVTVSLAGSNYTTSTDSLGGFEFRNVVPGPYIVIAVDAVLASLGSLGSPVQDSLAVTVPVVDQPVKLSLRPREPVIARVCPGAAASPANLILTGEVRAPDERPVRNGRVRVTWLDGMPNGGELALEAVTDTKGRFRLCGVGSGTTLRVQVVSAGASVDESIHVPLGLPVADVVITLRAMGRP